MDKWENQYDKMLAKIEASGKLKKDIRINLRGVDGFVIEPIMLKDLEGLLPANNNPNDSYLHTYTVIHHDRNFELPAFIDYGIRFVNRLCILYMRGEISKIANRNLSMRWHEDIIFEIQRIIFEEE